MKQTIIIVILYVAAVACEHEELSTRTGTGDRAKYEHGPLARPLDSADGRGDSLTLQRDWDKILTHLDETLDYYSTYLLEYDTAEVLDQNFPRAEDIFSDMQDSIRTGNLALQEARKGNPSEKKLSQLDDTVKELVVELLANKNRLDILSRLKSPLDGEVVLDSGVRPFLDCGGMAGSCNPSQQWWNQDAIQGGSPANPILVASGLEEGLTFTIVSMTGTYSLSTGGEDIDCGAPATVSSNDIPVGLPVLQFTDKSLNVEDPGVKTPGDYLALPTNDTVFTQDGVPINAVTKRIYISLPNPTYADDTGFCTLTYRLIL